MIFEHRFALLVAVRIAEEVGRPVEFQNHVFAVFQLELRVVGINVFGGNFELDLNFGKLVQQVLFHDFFHLGFEVGLELVFAVSNPDLFLFLVVEADVLTQFLNSFFPIFALFFKIHFFEFQPKNF